MAHEYELRKKLIGPSDDQSGEDTEVLAQLYLHSYTALQYIYAGVMCRAEPHPNCDVVLAVGSVVNELRKGQKNCFRILTERGELPEEFKAIEERLKADIDTVLVPLGQGVNKEFGAVEISPNGKKETFH